MRRLRPPAESRAAVPPALCWALEPTEPLEEGACTLRPHGAIDPLPLSDEDTDADI